MKTAGETVPGDVVVSVPTYVAHRDPVIFPDPDGYRPEQWLEGREKAKQIWNASFRLVPTLVAALDAIYR